MMRLLQWASTNWVTTTRLWYAAVCAARHDRRCVGSVVLIAAVVLSGCGFVEEAVFGEEVEPTTKEVAPPPPAEPPDTVSFTSCNDLSLSVPRRLFEGGLTSIAEIAEDWPKEPARNGASVPWPALDLQVRAIGADSYNVEEPTALLMDGLIAGIPSVIEPGHPSEPNFVEWDQAYRRQLAIARGAYKRAARSALRIAQHLRSLDPPSQRRSQVWGCISAAAETMPHTGAPKLAIWSDLKNNVHPQIAGSLRGIHILVIHLCDHARLCHRQRRAWGSRLKDRGATHVQFIRFDRADQSLADFLRSSP